MDVGIEFLVDVLVHRGTHNSTDYASGVCRTSVSNGCTSKAVVVSLRSRNDEVWPQAQKCGRAERDLRLPSFPLCARHLKVVAMLNGVNCCIIHLAFDWPEKVSQSLKGVRLPPWSKAKQPQVTALSPDPRGTGRCEGEFGVESWLGGVKATYIPAAPWRC